MLLAWTACLHAWPAGWVAASGYAALAGAGECAAAAAGQAPALPSLASCPHLPLIALPCLSLPYRHPHIRRSFAYVMMQRWLDAGKCFNFILTYISK